MLILLIIWLFTTAAVIANGSKDRKLLEYATATSSALLSVCSWLFGAVLHLWVPFICCKLLNNTNSGKLIAVGTAILLVGVLAECQAVAETSSLQTVIKTSDCS